MAEELYLPCWIALAAFVAACADMLSSGVLNYFGEESG